MELFLAPTSGCTPTATPILRVRLKSIWGRVSTFNIAHPFSEKIMAKRRRCRGTKSKRLIKTVQRGWRSETEEFVARMLDLVDGGSGESPPRRLADKRTEQSPERLVADGWGSVRAMGKMDEVQLRKQVGSQVQPGNQANRTQATPTR